jgi:hypothetical protein
MWSCSASPDAVAGRALRRAAVDPAFRHRRQLAVRRVFRVEGLLQHRGAVLPAELLREGDQRAAAGDLVVLDRRRGGDDRRVQHVVVVGEAEDAGHRVAGRALHGMRTGRQSYFCNKNSERLSSRRVKLPSSSAG